MLLNSAHTRTQATRTALSRTLTGTIAANGRGRRVGWATVAQPDFVPKPNTHLPTDNTSVDFGMSASEQVVLGRSPCAPGQTLATARDRRIAAWLKPKFSWEKQALKYSDPGGMLVAARSRGQRKHYAAERRPLCFVPAQNVSRARDFHEQELGFMPIAEQAGGVMDELGKILRASSTRRRMPGCPKPATRCRRL